MTNLFPSELFFTSIALLTGTFLYLLNHAQVTKSIYKYIGYILLGGIIIYIVEFAFAYRLGYGASIYSYLFFIFLYIIACGASMTYVFKKHFQYATWFPRILFTLLAISLYYLPTYFGMVLAVIIYDLQ